MLVAPLVAAVIVALTPSMGNPSVDECIRAPVNGRIVAAFREPACPYCAGHRTVDFAADPGDVIRAPVRGAVSFSGSVAGTWYVTISRFGHDLVVTVGGGVPGAPGQPRAGDSIEAGEIIGQVGTEPDTISVSVRRRVVDGPDEYLDVGRFMARQRHRARLIPADGTPARPVAPGEGCERPLWASARG